MLDTDPNESDVLLTVDDGDIDVPEDADRLLDGHYEWPAQIGLHQFYKAQLLVVTAKVAVFAGPFSERLRLLLQ
jgi:hypothetical protein